MLRSSVASSLPQRKIHAKPIKHGLPGMQLNHFALCSSGARRLHRHSSTIKLNSRSSISTTRVQSASVDPLAQSDGVYRPGKLLTIHSRDELDKFIADHKSKLVILMAKSSHCRPCKKFFAAYMHLATRFPDCCFLDIVGDESPTTRKMMVDMKVKATPTFFLYRDGQLVHSFSGIKNDALKNAILERLRPEERGREWDGEEPQLSSEDED